MTLRYFYHEYKSVLLFALLLAAGFAGCHRLSRYIPVDLYQQYINPIQSASLITLCVCGSWALFPHHGGIRTRKLAGGALVVWSLLLLVLLIHYIIYRTIGEEAARFISLRGWELFIGNIFAWLLLIYPTELLRPGWLNVRRACLQLLPIAVVGVADYLLSVDLRILLWVYPLLLMIILIGHIHAYRIWCEENYSSMDNIDVQWVWRYISMYVIVGVSYYNVCFSAHPTRLFTHLALLFFVLIYSIDYILFRPDPWQDILSKQPPVSEREEEPDIAPEEKTQEELPFAAYRETLEQWMAAEKPYLNKEFRLLDMRQVLPLNRTYLSQLINSEYGCNFYQFVTGYRIREAKRLMREKPDMKMQEVAEQCGFSSLTVFGRIFARETGMTPTEWSLQSDNSSKNTTSAQL